MKKPCPRIIAAVVLTVCIVILAAALTNQPPPDEPKINVPAPPPASVVYVPILVYHHINRVPANATSATKSFFIEPAWLEKHLQFLKDNGFHGIHFSDLADYFERGAPLPSRPVIISFDDGYKDTFLYAAPLLLKYNMTATVFVITNSVGRAAYMTWDQIKQLQAAGCEIGSHSLWHPYLAKSKKAEREIIESKKILEEKLGVAVTAFAYPYGDYNTRIENIVKAAGYKTGRSFSTGAGISKENLFHVPVVRVYANVGLERWKAQLFPPS